MTSDEQEYGSRRYIAPRLTILPLTSGRIAVGAGFNPPDLLHICEDRHDLADYLLGFAEAHLAEEFARREAQRARQEAFARADVRLELNLDNLELKL